MWCGDGVEVGWRSYLVSRRVPLREDKEIGCWLLHKTSGCSHTGFGFQSAAAHAMMDEDVYHSDEDEKVE